jgi:hypothetical protein
MWNESTTGYSRRANRQRDVFSDGDQPPRNLVSAATSVLSPSKSSAMRS